MTFRTWAKLLAATLGVGALAAASQLGVAYGLGILRLTRVLDVQERDQWVAQLSWVAWIATTSGVVGALSGARLLTLWSRRSNPERSEADPDAAGEASTGASRSTTPGTGAVLALAVAAGVGAAVTVPLTMQPARTAQVIGVHPVFVIGLCAALGAVVGIAAGFASVTRTVARWSCTAMGAAVWVLAVVSVAPSLGVRDPLPSARLGVFDAGFLAPAVTQRTALFTMPAVALLLGAALGWAARRREFPMLSVALAGLPGPALLTLAYLIAGPGTGAHRYQVVPYWAAMTAAGAGVLGSVLAAVLRRGDHDEADVDDEPTAEQPSAAAGPPQQPGPQQPGPQRPATPASAPSDDAPKAPSPAPTAEPERHETPPKASPPREAARPDREAARPDRKPARPDGTEATTGVRPERAAASRRSTMADAFRGRTGEWPTSRGGRPAGPPEAAGGVALGDQTAPLATAPEPSAAQEEPKRRGRFGRKRHDDEFVDWVNGLGSSGRPDGSAAGADRP
ncbi:hypothetical protein [Mangrovihabitans endophyticus]|nr:hypothetical protein [Mangrovihabitans endophyticus]